MKKLIFLLGILSVLMSCETVESSPDMVKQTMAVTATPPDGNFIIEPNHNLTFTNFTNGIGTDPIVWPITLSDPFIFPVTEPQGRLYDNYGGNPDLFSGQAITVYLDGGPIIHGTCLTFSINGVPVATSTEPLALGEPIVLYYGLPVFYPDTIKIAVGAECSPIGFFNVDARRDSFSVTNITGVDLPSWNFPVDNGRTETQPFTWIDEQTLTVTLTGTGETCLRLYVNGQVYDEVTVTGSGDYNIDVPAVTGVHPRDAVILIIGYDC